MDRARGWFEDMFQQYGDCLSEQEILCTKRDFFYISDVETYELLHLSVERPEEVYPSFKNYCGRKCYEVLQGRSSPCPFCTNSILRDDRYHIWIHRNDLTNKRYLLKDILLEWRGRPARMEIVIEVDDTDRMEEVLLESAKSRTMLLDCASFLMRANSLQSGLRDVIARIATFFEASGGTIQIFEPELEVRYFEKGFSVRSKHPSQEEKSFRLNEVVSGRILYIGDIAGSRLSQEAKDYYLRQGVRSMTIVPILFERQVVGGVGVYNPTQHLSELAQLDVHASWIGRMVNSFGLKDSVRRLQNYDELLGCYNFDGFRRRAAELTALYPQRKYAVLCYDVREFKSLNERFGLETGDALLRYFSASIENTLREGEILGRISADHLCVLRWYDDEEELRRRFESAVELLGKFGELYQIPFQTNVVCGVYMLPSGCQDINRGLDNASTALKAGKQRPGSQFTLYDQALNRRGMLETAIGQSLKTAMGNGEITVHFQPQYRYSTGEMVGMEALARWNSAELGRLSPDEFVPVLESKGLIYELDLFIWEQVCRQIRSWLDQGLTLPSVSVNVSRLDILRPSLLQDLLALLGRYQLQPDALHLEITETAYANAQEELIAKVQALQDAGFVVEMDDFGKGYSSLNVLSDVPVEILKLDIRFLDLTGDTGRRGSILGSIVRMARWMDLPVIAEGVESRAQAEFLKSLGCDLMQGFYFSRPIPIGDLEALLREQKPHGHVGTAAPIGLLNATEFLDPKSKTSLLFENMGPAMLVEYFNGDLDALMTNDSLYTLFGAKRSDCLPYLRRMLELLEEPSRQRFMDALLCAIREGEYAYEGLMHSKPPQEKAMWLNVSLRLLASQQGRYILLMQLRDITQQKESSWELQRHQEMLRILSQLPGFSTFEYDVPQDELYLHLNHPEKGMLYLKKERYLAEFLWDNSWTPAESAPLMAGMLRQAMAAPGNGMLECSLCLTTPEPRFCRIHYISLANESGQVYCVVGRVDDLEDEMRQRRQAEEALREAAMRDSFTGAWNRKAMEERVGAALAEDRPGALLLFDMDDLQQVNEQHGHLTGDEVLRDFATMLRKVLEEDAEIGRMAGDEFAVFLPGLTSETLAETLAERILHSISSFLRPELSDVSASCGLALAEPGMADFHSFFLRADFALSEAKRSGKGKYVLYRQGASPLLQAEKPARQEGGAANPSRALAADAFHLLYHAESDEDGIWQALAHIGRWLDVSRVYIFENSPDGSAFSNTFEWCNSNVVPQKDSLQNIKFSDVGDYYENFNEDSIFACLDLKELPEAQKCALERQGIYAVLQYALGKPGAWYGMIGFDECRDNRHWTEAQLDTLTRTAEVLSVFLTRLRRGEGQAGKRQ